MCYGYGVIHFLSDLFSVELAIPHERSSRKSMPKIEEYKQFVNILRRTKPRIVLRVECVFLCAILY
jgi:hypothetical protein